MQLGTFNIRFRSKFSNITNRVMTPLPCHVCDIVFVRNTKKSNGSAHLPGNWHPDVTVSF